MVGLKDTGGVQNCSVWYSGKYPAHALNMEMERKMPDLEEKILVLPADRFTCSALFLFLTLLFCSGGWMFQVIFTDSVLSCLYSLAK